MKKLITLTALLLCAVVSSWADEAISCSAYLSSTATPTTTNCTFKYFSDEGSVGTIPSGTETTVSGTDYYYAKINGDKNYYEVTLAQTIGGAKFTSFQAGDAITVYLYSNGTTVAYKVGKTKTAVSKEKQTKSTIISVPHTLTASEIESDGTLRIYRSSSNTYFAGISVTGTRSIETYTVTFNAGSNGTCGTASLTEESAGAGVTLPVVTPNSGYVFNGWFTAASDGTKAGVSGDTYHPTGNITLYAQYSAEAAPTIEIDNYSPSTNKDVAKTFTATATGAPTPTVTWYQSETATTSGGTEVGTGSTYKPNVSAEGTFYYYAVASNGVGSDATSSLITLTVTDPNKYVSGNAYYMAEGETPVPDEMIFADDITMTFVNGKKGESFIAGVADAMISDVNPNFVASVSGTSANNGWKAHFTPAANGKLSVGVIINKNKTFSITNVTSFKYEGKNGAGDPVVETVDGNTKTTANEDAAKLYVVVTIDVVKGTTYDFSVASSKMGFYGFEFTPTTTVRTNAGNWASFTPSWNATLEDGATAYIITGVDGDAITASTVGVLEAGKGYFVKGDAASKDYTATATSEAATDTDGNLIVGCAEATNINAGVNAKYVLGTNGSGKSGLFLVNSDVTVPAGKAYLETKSAAARQFLSLDFDEVVTGIETIEAKKSLLDGEFFNLKGQRVAQPQKGLYILNGKKVVLK